MAKIALFPELAPSGTTSRPLGYLSRRYEQFPRGTYGTFETCPQSEEHSPVGGSMEPLTCAPSIAELCRLTAAAMGILG